MRFPHLFSKADSFSPDHKTPGTVPHGSSQWMQCFETAWQCPENLLQPRSVRTADTKPHIPHVPPEPPIPDSSAYHLTPLENLRRYLPSADSDFPHSWL